MKKYRPCVILILPCFMLMFPDIVWSGSSRMYNHKSATLNNEIDNIYYQQNKILKNDMTIPGDLTVNGSATVTNNLTVSGINYSPNNSFIDLTLTGTQSLPDSVNTKVNFSSVIYDTQDEYDIASGSVIIKNDGTYSISASCYLSNILAADSLNLILVKNNVDIRQSVVYSGGIYHFATLNCIDKLVVGDELAIHILVNSSGGSTINGGSLSTWWTIQKNN